MKIDTDLGLALVAIGMLFAASLSQQKKSAKKKKKLPGQPGPVPIPGQSSPAIQDLRDDISWALSTGKSFSASSKTELGAIDSLLASGKEKEALEKLRALSETERNAHAEEFGRAMAGWSMAKGYAFAGWELVHFGGKASPEAIREMQAKIGVPQTGHLDEATLSAVKKITEREIWPLALTS